MFRGLDIDVTVVHSLDAQDMELPYYVSASVSFSYICDIVWQIYLKSALG